MLWELVFTIDKFQQLFPRPLLSSKMGYSYPKIPLCDFSFLHKTTQKSVQLSILYTALADPSVAHKGYKTRQKLHLTRHFLNLRTKT